MKQFLWNIIVSSSVVIPAKIRHLICRILFAVESRRNSPQGVKDLFLLNDALMFQLNDAAIRCDGGIHPKVRFMRYHEYFASKVKYGEKVMDVGCGYGFVAQCIAQTGADVIGVDIDGERIRYAQEHFSHPNCRFILGDATKNDIQGKVDIIVLSNVLEHLSERSVFLKQLVRNYSPQRFLIRVPCIDRDWTVPLRKELGILYFRDPDHKVEYTMESLREELTQALLSIKESRVNWGEIWAEVIPSACCSSETRMS